MTMLIVGGHTDVPHHTRPSLPTVTSAVCSCGAVFDNGTLDVPDEYRGMCGRCAFTRGRRLSFDRVAGPLAYSGDP
jgi:hypothetical protein